MTSEDHNYFVNKLEEKERELKVYRECFSEMMHWFNKNRKHLKKVPVSKIPRNPVSK